MNKRFLRKVFMDEATGAGGDASAGGGAAASAGDASGASRAAGDAAGAGSATGAAAATSQDSAASWLQSLTDADVKTFAEQKGFKEAGDAVKALRDVEAKYTIPESADAYQLPVPEGQDGAFAKQAAGWFQKAGIPVEQAKALTTEWNAAQAAQVAAHQQQVQQEMTALKGEWGGQYETNVELGRRTMRTFGIAPEVIDKISGQLGDVQTLRVFHRIGQGLSEGTLNPGSSGGSEAGSVDPDAARAARMFPSMQAKS